MCAGLGRPVRDQEPSVVWGRTQGSMSGGDAWGLARPPCGAGSPGDRTAAKLENTEEGMLSPS